MKKINVDKMFDYAFGWPAILYKKFFKTRLSRILFLITFFNVFFIIFLFNGAGWMIMSFVFTLLWIIIAYYSGIVIFGIITLLWEWIRKGK